MRLIVWKIGLGRYLDYDPDRWQGSRIIINDETCNAINKSRYINKKRRNEMRAFEAGFQVCNAIKWHSHGTNAQVPDMGICIPS